MTLLYADTRAAQWGRAATWRNKAAVGLNLVVGPAPDSERFRERLLVDVRRCHSGKGWCWAGAIRGLSEARTISPGRAFLVRIVTGAQNVYLDGLVARCPRFEDGSHEHGENVGPRQAAA